MKTINEISREERFNEDYSELKKASRKFQKQSRSGNLRRAIEQSYEESEW